MEKYKEKLLKSLTLHIDFVREKIREKLEETKIIANRSIKGLNKMFPEDQIVFMNSRANAQIRVEELTHLEGSPYFMKCEVIDESGQEKKYFLSKHQFAEESIYSWVSPIAAIRFEDPGKVSYKLADGTLKTVTITQKEQYMIVDGKVIFFALESKDKPRELIYQEHFTKQKSEFALPEIVAQMEKAQDQVIRASHKGPLVISGPAGSGKTTLALHRVAYLTQAPDTALFYPPRSIIVFVQDTGTKKYFSTLLPGLGIHDVHITTFSEWAFSILGIQDYSYIERYGENEEERDLYEYQKLRTLREKPIAVWNKNIFTMLNAQYRSDFSEVSKRLFDSQKKEKKLDRFDIVILLKSYIEKYKKFEIRREYQTFVNDKLVRKTEKTPVLYSLMVVDEFQNYLPEQLEIFTRCLNQDTKSAIYVGDIAQQVKLGTVRDWKDVGETILPERNITLNKVYRNTKNILLFIKSLGYSIEIVEGIKEGPAVVEKITNTPQEEIEHIKKSILPYEKGTIGIVGKEEAYLETFKEAFAGMHHIHVLTMLESQGVEFDLVFLVGMNKTSFEITHHFDVLPEHIEERKRMQKDLLYVALTRAITELHVLGKASLESILTKEV